MSEHSNLLVLGAPRSGTTLLSAMLGCHSDIALLNEDVSGAFTRIFSKRYRGVKLCPPHQVELEQPASMRAKDFARAQVQRVLRPIARAAGRPPLPGGFYKSRYSIADMLAMPEPLRVIGIVRGPGAVTESIQRRGRQSEATARYRWTRLVEIFDELRRSDHPNLSLAIVRFDDLVSAPEPVMLRLLEWLGLEFEPAMLEGYKHTPQYAGRTRIDAGLAGGGLESDLQHPLLRESPALAAAYRGLYEAALEPGKV